MLGSDYTKSLHLQNDRSLEFHTPMGCHYEVRLPRFGRDLAYLRQSTEVLVPSVGVSSDGSGFGEVFRLDLERGQFLRPWQVDVGGDDSGSGLQGGINAGAVNVATVAERTHGLCAFGTSIGTVEFYDPRSKGRVAVLGSQDGEVTALDYSDDGLSLALGTSTGQIRVFDLRNPRPLMKKDQGMGNPIKNLIHIKTPTEERKLLSADKRIIKIWDEQTGDLWTSVEPMVDLNHVTHIKDSGMILTANEVSFREPIGCSNYRPLTAMTTGQANALLLHSQFGSRAEMVRLLGQLGPRNGDRDPDRNLRQLQVPDEARAQDTQLGTSHREDQPAPAIHAWLLRCCQVV